MPSDISFLEFAEDTEAEHRQDSAAVFGEYLRCVANGKMRRYKQLIQYGGKQGQTYYGHVMDLASVADRLRPAIGLEDCEMRCVLLALTMHDMNKISPYNMRADGREAKYADAATPENIRMELELLEVDAFFRSGVTTWSTSSCLLTSTRNRLRALWFSRERRFAYRLFSNPPFGGHG